MTTSILAIAILALSNDHTMYLRNLHDSGYDPKNDFTKSGTLVTQ
jgi:hypothetical protein